MSKVKEYYTPLEKAIDCERNMLATIDELELALAEERKKSSEYLSKWLGAQDAFSALQLKYMLGVMPKELSSVYVVSSLGLPVGVVFTDNEREAVDIVINSDKVVKPSSESFTIPFYAAYKVPVCQTK